MSDIPSAMSNVLRKSRKGSSLFHRALEVNGGMEIMKNAYVK